jgi:hypothetical protein
MCSAYFVSCYGGKSLKHEFTPQQRKRIKAKMAEVFKENLAGLSTEFQKILLDDLVTAFQNRINVLKRVQAKRAANGD